MRTLAKLGGYLGDLVRPAPNQTPTSPAVERRPTRTSLDPAEAKETNNPAAMEMKQLGPATYLVPTVIRHAQYFDEGNKIAFIDEDNSIFIFDTKTKEQLGVYQAIDFPWHAVSGINFSPNGDFIAGVLPREADQVRTFLKGYLPTSNPRVEQAPGNDEADEVKERSVQITRIEQLKQRATHLAKDFASLAELTEDQWKFILAVRAYQNGTVEQIIDLVALAQSKQIKPSRLFKIPRMTDCLERLDNYLEEVILQFARAQQVVEHINQREPDLFDNYKDKFAASSMLSLIVNYLFADVPREYLGPLLFRTLEALELALSASVDSEFRPVFEKSMQNLALLHTELKKVAQQGIPPNFDHIRDLIALLSNKDNEVDFVNHQPMLIPKDLIAMLTTLEREVKAADKERDQAKPKQPKIFTALPGSQVRRFTAAELLAYCSKHSNAVKKTPLGDQYIKWEGGQIDFKFGLAPDAAAHKELIREIINDRVQINGFEIDSPQSDVKAFAIQRLGQQGFDALNIYSQLLGHFPYHIMCFLRRADMVPKNTSRKMNIRLDPAGLRTEIYIGVELNFSTAFVLGSHSWSPESVTDDTGAPSFSARCEFRVTPDKTIELVYLETDCMLLTHILQGLEVEKITRIEEPPLSLVVIDLRNNTPWVLGAVTNPTCITVSDQQVVVVGSQGTGAKPLPNFTAWSCSAGGKMLFSQQTMEVPVHIEISPNATRVAIEQVHRDIVNAQLNSDASTLIPFDKGQSIRRRLHRLQGSMLQNMAPIVWVMKTDFSVENGNAPGNSRPAWCNDGVLNGAAFAPDGRLNYFRIGKLDQYKFKMILLIQAGNSLTDKGACTVVIDEANLAHSLVFSSVVGGQSYSAFVATTLSRNDSAAGETPIQARGNTVFIRDYPDQNHVGSFTVPGTSVKTMFFLKGRKQLLAIDDKGHVCLWPGVKAEEMERAALAETRQKQLYKVDRDGQVCLLSDGLDSGAAASGPMASVSSAAVVSPSMLHSMGGHGQYIAAAIDRCDVVGRIKLAKGDGKIFLGPDNTLNIINGKSVWTLPVDNLVQLFASAMEPVVVVSNGAGSAAYASSASSSSSSLSSSSSAAASSTRTARTGSVVGGGSQADALTVLRRPVRPVPAVPGVAVGRPDNGVAAGKSSVAEFSAIGAGASNLQPPLPSSASASSAAAGAPPPAARRAT